MTKHLLLTRSRHDIGNQYLYAYSQEILEGAQSHGWRCDRAEDEQNASENVQSRLEKSELDLIIFNGHGNDDEICGHADEVLLGIDSATLLSGTVVFSRTCSAVNKLGKQAVSEGCRAFIGYNGDFIIPRLHEFESTPLKDHVAKPVLEVSNLVANGLVKGSVVEAAVSSAKRKASDLMLKMLSSQEPYHAATFRALFNNHSKLVFEGKAGASV